MKVTDLHADVISKLLEHPGAKWGNDVPGDLFDVTPKRLEDGGIALQVFALYLPDSVNRNPETLFRATELFWSEVLTKPQMKLVTCGADIAAALKEGKIGAILSLEGAEGLQGHLWALRLMYKLGLRLLGPTWNHANWACDGAMEPRGGGLTRAGRQLVAECGKLGILLDVSHLSERGFWDVAELSAKPIFASHSNVRTYKDHQRNLRDDQLAAIIRGNGIIGITFVPWFLTANEPATIDDVLRHVEYICALGGVANVAFGSDFDGIERHPIGLRHPGFYPSLIEALLKRYPEPLVRGFAGENANRYLMKNL
ncbi:dipeptidase [Cohnella yongneupensis]|uniref:Dipeptidase n=1 Tax=Cohnella yongneupensis TaxID=425006 RepID=A0ABW0R7M8_9BACL